MATTSGPDAVTRFLAALPADRRTSLQRLRRIIRAAAPGAQDCIAYGLPSLRVNGRYLVSYGAAKHHLAFYPGSVLSLSKKELAGFATTKGSIHFQPDRPIPAALVRKLVKARLARIAPGATRAGAPRGRAR